ncbi:hypothetical protein HLK59_26940 [Streptomyces sp. S3(2020)]|nr:hypothetical protein [Streptomyces sp. S3(2020)]
MPRGVRCSAWRGPGAGLDPGAEGRGRGAGPCPASRRGGVRRGRPAGGGGGGPAGGARWFCRAEALELAERDGRVRAGVNTLCMEYGVRDRALVECSGGSYPQVVLLERRAGAGYRVVSRQEPPDGAGYAQWTESHFGLFAERGAQDPMSSAGLEAAARTHFGLSKDAPISPC